jgi:hypothetical protein
MSFLGFSIFHSKQALISPLFSAIPAAGGHPAFRPVQGPGPINL